MQAQSDISDVELLCPECDYNLSGLTSDRCPWCGWSIDVQELVAGNLSRESSARLGVAGTALLVGLCSLVALTALFSRVDQRLAWRDALAVLSVLIVAVAHLGLAVAALRAHHHWPMRAGEASNMFRIIGWGSIAAGIVAATPLLYAAPSPLVVKGVHVNGVLEFLMTAAFFSLPGVLLLILRFVSYRHVGRKLYLSNVKRVQISGPPFAIDVDTRYEVSQLLQEWSDALRPTSPEVEEMIARTWEVETAMAQEEGRNLFNGRVGRLTSVNASPTALQLALGPTCYRDFLGTNLFHAAQVARINPAFRADALGTSALVLTSDGFTALGLRSGNVAFHAQWMHTFGGLLEEADRTSDGYDLSQSLHRELKEELGVNADEISRVAVTGLVRDRAIDQPELLFDVALRLSRGDLLARFRAENDHEHTEIKFVADDPEAIAAFLRAGEKVTPVAQAALLLHGKHAWGAEWYEQACYSLYGQLPGKVAS